MKNELVDVNQWGQELQLRLIEVGPEQEPDVQNLMAEAACLLAVLTRRHAQQALPNSPAAGGGPVR